MPRFVRSPGRYTPVAVLAVTLGVFALAVAYVTVRQRTGLREQVLRREAATLTQIANLQLSAEAEALPDVNEAPGELLYAVLRASKRIRGVFAVRVFDAQKRLNGALPYPWSDTPASDDEWAQLAAGTPLARLYSRESAAEVIGMAPAATHGRAKQPLLETWLPLRRADTAPLSGVAQVWTDGESVAEEFNALDQRLLEQAAIAWAAGAIIITAVLGWAFQRLARANRELRARSEDLMRANRELTLAAKASALGAVAAHLMHELKNPVAGLEQFVATQSEAGRADADGELAAASELTRRLRTMINDVVSVMRDEQTGTEFELDGAEMAELVKQKAQPIAAQRGVSLETAAGATAGLPARRANLARLVLHNLVQNAIEASAAGTTVRLRAERANGGVAFVVEDEGPGLSSEVRARLFQPCPSSKRGGSGIGLALSQQLARQAGGRIELLRTDERGTCFRLVLDPEL